MLKQNALRSKNLKSKCSEFSALQKRDIKMQQKISVLQYSLITVATESLPNVASSERKNLKKRRWPFRRKVAIYVMTCQLAFKN